MASEADLLIEAGYSDAKLARDSAKVIGMFKKTGEQAEKAFQSAVNSVSGSEKVKATAREIENLKRQFDPLYAASKRYEAQVLKLNRAHQAGALNAAQHEIALDRLKKEYAGGADSASTASRKFGGSLQQVGFQVGDFATQVGAGTSATQALGQQLPQLLGAFGTFGALAGAAAAIMIPLGSALIKTAFDSETLEDRMKALEKSTSAYADAAELAATPIEELRQKYGELADEIDRLNQTSAVLAGAASAANLSATIGAFAKQFGGFDRTLYAGGGETFGAGQMKAASEYTDTIDVLRATFDLAEKEAKQLAGALEMVSLAKTPDEQAAALDWLQTSLVAMAGSAEAAQKRFGELLGDGGVADLVKQLGVHAGAAQSESDKLFATYSANTDKMKDLQDQLANAEAEHRKAMAEGNKTVADVWGRAIVDLTGKLRELREEISDTDAQFDAMHQSVGKQYADYAASRTAGEMIRSTDAMGAAKEIIKKYEGYLGAARWDENAYRGGYGSSTVTLSDGTIQKLTKGQSVNAADAERDLERRIGLYFEEQRRVMGQAWAGLTPQQVGALTSVQHNYGSLPSRIRPALATGDANLIAQALAGLAMDYTKSERASGKAARGERPMNYNRRMGEAAAFGDTTAVSEAATAEMEKQRDIAAEQKKLDDAAAADRKRKLDDLKRWSEQLSSQLITEQQRAELERQRAAQIAAINAGPGSDAEKAAAIARVNAAMERQVTVMALTEEAKRRGVDLDAQMIGSAMTYRQAIEALGDAQMARSLADQQAKTSADQLAEAQAFANQQMQTLQDGFIDAIIAGEDFADVLKNVAAQMAKAWAQAALFGTGPMAAQGGGGMFAGLFQQDGFLSQVFGGFRAAGGPIDTGRAYVVGERGPEIIVPRSAGQVIPNHRLGGGGGGMSMVIDLRGTTGDDALDRKMQAAGARILAQARAQAPGWIADDQKWRR